MASRRLLPTLVLAYSCIAAPNEARRIGFQTGIDLGSTFAGGMVFDKTHNRLFLTGATYARGFFVPEANERELEGEMNSDCFFTVIQFTPEAKTLAEWRQPSRLGYVKDTEACSTAHYMPNHDRIFLGASATGESIGRADVEGDQLPQLKDVKLFGEVISVSLDHLYNIAPVLPQHYLFGGGGFYHSEVNYPFAITSAPRPPNVTPEEHEVQEQPIYVASLYSKYEGQWTADREAREVDLSRPYVEGNVWGIAIQKIHINRSNATNIASILDSPTHMEREWQQSLITTNFQMLRAAAMVYVNDKLLLAGSTYDFGEQFAGEDRIHQDFQDYDGFLVKLDPETGAISDSPKLRIQSKYETDDIIHGICLHPADNDGHVKFVYVVGYNATHNLDYDALPPKDYKTVAPQAFQEEGGAFVMQVDLDSMTVVWEDKIVGSTIEAIDCAVTDDGENLYVVGHVGDDQALPDKESKGGDDVWIRMYNTLGGIPQWGHQLGSDKDEELARGGAIVVDSDNNAIIYGNTKGSMGRVRAEDLERPDNTTDIFILTVTADGPLEPNPVLIFQIPKYYFGAPSSGHKVLIVSLSLVAVAVFLFVMGIESTWKPVNLWYYLFLSDTVRGSKSQRKNKKETDPTEEGTGEREDDQMLYSQRQNQKGASTASQSVSEEEKTETFFV